MDEVLNALARIEMALEKNKPSRFSWWPFWTAGWMFTICLHSGETSKFLESAGLLEQVAAGAFTWLFWPAFLGACFSA